MVLTNSDSTPPLAAIRLDDVTEDRRKGFFWEGAASNGWQDNQGTHLCLLLPC